MPSEQPNENMDKVLKAYAKKRREDSTQIEMDLPTRNMLQAEVKRTLGKVPVPAATRPRPRFAWWPQLIIGVASAAALAIAVLVWKLPSRNETRESDVVKLSQSAPASEGTTIASKNDSKDSASDAAWTSKDSVVENGFKAAAPAPAEVQTPAPVPALAAESKLSAPLAKREIESDKRAEITSPAVVASAVSPTPAASTSAPVATAPTAPAQQPPTAAPSGAIGSAAPASKVETKSLGKSVAANFAAPSTVAPQPEKQRIRFAQINNRAQYRENLNSPPLPKVLTNFGLERTGTNLIVRDSDGSIYSGKVFVNSIQQNTTAFAIHGFGGAANWADAIPDDNFAFRVSGYNKKLRQKIVFSGNITNSIQNVLTISNALNQQNTVQNQQTMNILLNGRVQVGRNNEFTIEAAPVTK